MQIDTNKIIEILKFIKPYEEITEETDLFEEGILDSLTLLIFITKLEEIYHTTLLNEDLRVDDICTAKDIVDFLKKIL